MALRRPGRTRRVSITPLIDVIFLLLLFFMLASTFTDRAELEFVASPSAPGSGIDSALLRLDVGARTLTFEGAPVALDTLARTVAGNAGPSGAVLAVITADDVDTERLVKVLLALREADSVTIRIMEPAR